MDQSKVSINSLIDYTNRSSLYPLTITQSLQLFEMTCERNLDQPRLFLHGVIDAKKTRGPPPNPAANQSASNRNPLELRTYDLTSFLQKHLPIINEAVKKLTPEFLKEYCVDGMKELNSNNRGIKDDDMKLR